MSSDDADEAPQLEGDRRTVAALVAAGDSLATARDVDHWIYFPTSAARERFREEVTELGFTPIEQHDEGDAPNRFSLSVSRIDHVDLESIHRVVMTLFAAAKRSSGVYDGWECPVEAGE